MKRCPECGREYDSSMMFCLDDGSELLYGPAKSETGASATGFSSDDPQTAILHSTAQPGEVATRAQIITTDQTAALPSGVAEMHKQRTFKKYLLIATAAIAIIALCGLLGYRYFIPGGSGALDSIAVLPFENASGDPNFEYLSDGMTETLIRSLSQLPKLNVKARSSVFRYKGKEVDPKTVASELGVQAVLLGRVVQRGDTLSLAIELIDARTENVIWSDQYDRKATDIVSLQNEIARDVAEKLRAKLSGAEADIASKGYTANPEAYQLYLRGRFHWNKRQIDDLKIAIEHFDAAIRIDDRFALAYAGLADAYSVMPYYENARSADLVAKALPYARRSVEIGEGLAETHGALAFVYENMWKWAEAEREYRRSLELDPNYSPSIYRFSRFELRVLRRDNEALARMKRAIEVEPSSLVANDNLSQMYQLTGELDAAIEQAKKATELDRNFAFGWVNLAFCYAEKKQFSEALAAAERTVEVGRRSSRSVAVLGVVYALAGRTKEAETIVAELKERYAEQKADGTEIAWIYASLNDNDAAFEWIEKAFNDRSALLSNLRAEFPYVPIRSDPRYAKLLDRMEMPK